MAVIPSQAAQTPVYDEQGGKIVHWDTGARFEINGVPVGLAVTVSPASGSANVCNVTLQVQDLNSVNLANVYEIAFYLSDSALGAGLAAHVPSGGVAITTGTAMFTKVTNLALDALTDATGKIIFSITDTSKTQYFIVTEVPGTGLLSVSARLLTANYG